MILRTAHMDPSPLEFWDSPHFFGQTLAQDLSTFDPSPNILLQYVDDLQHYCPFLSLSQCAISLLLIYLGSLGYHVSLQAQLCFSSVVYLCIQLNLRSKSLTFDRVQALQNIQSLPTADQILSFLVLTGFFHHRISNFIIIAKPLYQVARKYLQSPSLTWPLFTTISLYCGIPS